MTLFATDYDFGSETTGKPAQSGPVLETAHWGYVIRDAAAGMAPNAVAAAVARFTGAILLMSAAGLWILPDSVHGSDLFGMKLAAMVMFSVFGAYLYRAGVAKGHLEYQVDLHRGELRIGRSDLRGAFRLSSRLGFDEIASIYMLRSKDHARPTRLFLRLAGREDAVEVATGPEAALEAIRERLAADLSQHPRQPVEMRLARHGIVAA